MKKMNKCVPLKVSMYPKGKKKKRKRNGSRTISNAVTRFFNGST